MSLKRVIELVESVDKDLVLCNPEAPRSIAEDLSAYFNTHNVTVKTVQTASGRPTEVAVLSNDAEVLEVLDVDILRDFVEDSRGESDTVGISESRYEAFLAHLKETTFQSRDLDVMLHTSHEIEDRARFRSSINCDGAFRHR